MALDYLPIQVSLVPSERVFSSSAETDTKRRNRIHPVLMEALQMLKFSLKQQWLNFTDGWAVTEDELQYYADDDEDSADLLGKLTLEIREDGIDIDEVIHVVGQDDDDWLGTFCSIVMYPTLLTLTLYISREFYYTFAFTVLNVWLLNLPQHLLAITGSKPSAKPSWTGFDQLSNNYKPEPAKAAGSASRFAASRTAATLHSIV